MNSEETPNNLTPNTWVEKYGNYLYTVAMLKVGVEDTAKDLVQDTFLSALNALQSFRGASNEKTWLTSILNNKIIDFYRKKDVLKSTSALEATELNDISNQFFKKNGGWSAGNVPQQWNNTETALNAKEYASVLSICLQKLPPKMAPIFISKYIEEEIPEKICKEFEISSSNYWVILHRAKLLMRSCLENNWYK